MLSMRLVKDILVDVMSIDLNRPKIAVLLAAFNGSRYIEAQLDSIINQMNVHVTIIISDDLSTDGTYEILCQMSKLHDNIILLPQKKCGSPTKNFHYLLSSDDFSDYDYVAFSDQDDIWFTNKLDSAHLEITARKIYGYSSDVIAKYTNGKEVYLKKSYPLKDYDYFFESAGPGCTYVFKSCIVAEYIAFVNIHPEEVSVIDSHDWLIYAYVRSKNYGWYIDNNATLYYRQHASNNDGANIGLRAYYKRFVDVVQGGSRTRCLAMSALFIHNNQELNKLLGGKWISSLFLLKYITRIRRSTKHQVILFLLIFFGLFR